MFSIIKRPIITEKNTLHASALNEYAFEVAVDANRTQIKQAIEKLFSVKVLRVNTMIARKETRKLGRVGGTRKLWKKAIVKLKEGDKFDFVAS
jgi:large subunit ribosomal protein L23